MQSHDKIFNFIKRERVRDKFMATVFARGAHTMNTMVFKPMSRKGFHKQSSSADMIRETRKFEGDHEVKNKFHIEGAENDMNLWVPHEKTGIYYPKGQEKVMEQVSPGSVRDMDVNWFS